MTAEQARKARQIIKGRGYLKRRMKLMQQKMYYYYEEWSSHATTLFPFGNAWKGYKMYRRRFKWYMKRVGFKPTFGSLIRTNIQKLWKKK